VTEPEVVQIYRAFRNDASTVEERRRVWRSHALMLLAEFAERAVDDPEGCAGYTMSWRKAAGDDELPVRFRPYWAKIPLDDLKALWRVLERARHK
jgi:hypothetical protein